MLCTCDPSLAICSIQSQWRVCSQKKSVPITEHRVLYISENLRCFSKWSFFPSSPRQFEKCPCISWLIQLGLDKFFCYRSYSRLKWCCFLVPWPDLKSTFYRKHYLLQFSLEKNLLYIKEQNYDIEGIILLCILSFWIAFLVAVFIFHGLIEMRPMYFSILFIET